MAEIVTMIEFSITKYIVISTLQGRKNFDIALHLVKWGVLANPIGTVQSD